MLPLPLLPQEHTVDSWMLSLVTLVLVLLAGYVVSWILQYVQPPKVRTHPTPHTSHRAAMIWFSSLPCLCGASIFTVGGEGEDCVWCPFSRIANGYSDAIPGSPLAQADPATAAAISPEHLEHHHDTPHSIEGRKPRKTKEQQPQGPQSGGHLDQGDVMPVFTSRKVGKRLKTPEARSQASNFRVLFNPETESLALEGEISTPFCFTVSSGSSHRPPAPPSSLPPFI